MATRDAEAKASRTKAGRRNPENGAKKSSKESVSGKKVPNAETGSASAARSWTVDGVPRRPIQVLMDKSRTFWVFCDDGSVWVARHKKGSLRWIEAGPPLPGSPEDRLGGLAGRLENATETA